MKPAELVQPRRRWKHWRTDLILVLALGVAAYGAVTGKVPLSLGALGIAVIAAALSRMKGPFRLGTSDLTLEGTLDDPGKSESVTRIRMQLSGELPDDLSEDPAREPREGGP
jgi:hypothetical protein